MAEERESRGVPGWFGVKIEGSQIGVAMTEALWELLKTTEERGGVKRYVKEGIAILNFDLSSIGREGSAIMPLTDDPCYPPDKT